MRSLVLDGSTTLGFLMSDEQAPRALTALAALEHGVPAFVPAHWAFEVANGLLMAERRKRLGHADVAEAVEVLALLPIEVDQESGRKAWSETIALARQYGLTVYDAAYLELASRKGSALATGDAALARAAKKAGVQVV